MGINQFLPEAMFLITGCGRSGTKYTSAVLKACGLDVELERCGNDGAVSGFWAIDAPEYPHFHQLGKRPVFDVILHQVRHPLNAISSMITALPKSWNWVCKFTDLERVKNKVEQAANYWLYWNKLCEHIADYTYSVESIETHWGTISGLLGIDCAFPDGIPTNINSRPHNNLTWDDIRVSTQNWERIMELAIKYGYEIPERTDE